MRQTDLTFKELKSELKQPKYAIARYLVINEIGCCLVEEGEKEAEPILRGFLKNGSGQEKVITLAYLLLVKGPEPKTVKIIRKFRKKKKNKEIVYLAEMEVENYIK